MNQSSPPEELFDQQRDARCYREGGIALNKIQPGFEKNKRLHMQVRDRRRVSSALRCVTLERSEVTSGLNVSSVTQVSVSLKTIAFAWSVLNKRKVRSDKSSIVWGFFSPPLANCIQHRLTLMKIYMTRCFIHLLCGSFFLQMLMLTSKDSRELVRDMELTVKTDIKSWANVVKVSKCNFA